MRLRLDSIDLYHVRVPLREPLTVGCDRALHKEAIVLRLQTSRGAGWGECSIDLSPDDDPSALDSCWDSLCGRLGPDVLALGEVELAETCDVCGRVAAPTCAAAGLDIALWHAVAMARGLPLHVLLGGVARPIAAGLCLAGPATDDELLDGVRTGLAEGYRRVKIRIQPGWDLQPVAQVRQAWPDLPLTVDAAGGYSLDDLETLRNLDKYHLAAVEQPLPAEALDDSARLQAVLSAPICLRDAVVDGDAVREIARRRAARIISVDVQRAGGLTRALQIHEAARKADLTCWLGTTPDLGIGASAGLHLATLDGFTHPTDVASASRWFRDDVLEPPIVVDAGGYLHLPDGPGFGYRPSPEKIQKYALRHETLTA